MIKLYTYIFYSIYNRYTQWGEDEIPGIYAIGVMVVLQGLLLMGVINTSCLLFSLEWESDRSTPLLIFSIFFILDNILVYKKPGKHEILTFWANQPRSIKRKMSTFMVLHFLMSFGLFAFAVYLRHYY